MFPCTSKTLKMGSLTFIVFSQPTLRPGYIENPQRGTYRITQNGIDFLKIIAYNMIWLEKEFAISTLPTA